jgi:hypothetical protein
MEPITDLLLIANPHPTECKVCRGPSFLFGVVDFNKSCIEAQGRRLAVSGCPVYYRRCQHCAFVLTNAFDSWTKEAFRKHIYNEHYIAVDPDFVEIRPAGNANLVAGSFQAARSSIEILDFGGPDCWHIGCASSSFMRQHTIRFQVSTRCQQKSSI